MDQDEFDATKISCKLRVCDRFEYRVMGYHFGTGNKHAYDLIIYKTCSILKLRARFWKAAYTCLVKYLIAPMWTA